ncbi:MAG: peptidylprolyl isomerase [Planctomycetota bacterium]|jgi:cyclophilin family peptidyl-prolyl cis-trans isomerase
MSAIRCLLAALMVLCLAAAPASARVMGGLHDAATSGDADAVVMLLRYDVDVDVDALDDEGRTALMLAASGGHMPVVRLLVAAGADVTIEDEGKTAVDMASAEEATTFLAAVAAADEERNRPVYVKVTTSWGSFVLELDRARAPISVANFLAYLESDFYDGTVFHRVIDDFMIQGGGFTGDMQKKKTKAPIENEWRNGLKNTRGTIAMARLGGQPNSATSQFFINVADNAFLDEPRDGAGYAVFGHVVEGMSVLDRIKATPTTAQNNMQNVQVEPIASEHVAVVEKPGE